MPRRRPAVVPAVVVACAAVLLAGLPAGAVAVGTTASHATAASTATSAVAAPVALPAVAPVVLPPTPVDANPAPVPSPQVLAATLGPLLSTRSLGSVVAAVVDPVDGTVLYERGPGKAGTPASTLKVLTTTAALVALGPQTRLRTRVVKDGDGYVLVGAGDSTLSRRPATLSTGGRTASLQALADATAKALAGVPAFTLRYDDSLFTGPRTAPGWSGALLSSGAVAPVMALSVDTGRVARGSDTVVSDPALTAARDFAGRLAARGVKVKGVARGRAGAGASEVAGVDSPSITQLVEHTLTVSDNDMAEALGHLAGARLGGAGSFAGGAAAVTKVVAALGVPLDGMTISDGSGLSREDHVRPVTLARVLVAVARHTAPQGLPDGVSPVTWPVATGLPVAALTGTLDDRFRAPSVAVGRGVVRAKTGTLTGVQGLAGVVRDRDGRLLAFAFLAEGFAVKENAQAALDKAAAAVAACGCR